MSDGHTVEGERSLGDRKRWARRRALLLAMLGTAVLVGSVVGWWLIDPVTSAAYQGRGPARLQAVISGRDVHTVAFYQDLARARARGPMALSATLGAALVITGRLLDLRSGSGMGRAGLKADRVWLSLTTVSVGAVVLGISGLSVSGQARAPYLSEVMPSNASVLTDLSGEHHDWIELHNPTTEAVDLTGLHLSDDDDEPAKWQFPSVTVEPGGYLVVFASGKDFVDPGLELHANFRIAVGNEPVILVGADGETVIDRIPPTDVPRNASIGRPAHDPSRVCLFVEPTPGSMNTPECFDDARLGEPSIDVEGRVPRLV